MDTLVWSIELPPDNGSCYTAVDYVINDLGIFAKTEIRSKKSGTTAQLWGFRVGKNKVKGTDYLAQVQGRQALLWQKVTEMISGDQQITVSHPTEKGPSPEAAGWLCWEQDEDWEAGESLEEMVEAERNGSERFIEDEIIAETVLR